MVAVGAWLLVTVRTAALLVALPKAFASATRRAEPPRRLFINTLKRPAYSGFVANRCIRAHARSGCAGEAPMVMRLPRAWSPAKSWGNPASTSGGRRRVFASRKSFATRSNGIRPSGATASTYSPCLTTKSGAAPRAEGVIRMRNGQIAWRFLDSSIPPKVHRSCSRFTRASRAADTLSSVSTWNGPIFRSVQRSLAWRVSDVATSRPASTAKQEYRSERRTNLQARRLRNETRLRGKTWPAVMGIRLGSVEILTVNQLPDGLFRLIVYPEGRSTTASEQMRALVSSQ